MPRDVITRKRDALSLMRMSNDAFRASRLVIHAVKSIKQRRVIVSIDFIDEPAERAPFVHERLERHDLFSPAHPLEPICIDDGDEAIQAKMGGE